jgi:hypothetical protein
MVRKKHRRKSMKSYVYGMVLDTHTLALSGISGKLTEHLIKLYLFTNDTKNPWRKSDWRKEVWNLLHIVPKLKSSKKFPSNIMIRDIIGAYDDMTTELSNLIIEEYIEEYPDLKPCRTDYDELNVIVNNYLDWISDVLSTKGVVSSSEVYAKLDELGL